MNEATSDSFQFGLKALLKKHPDLQSYASTAHQLTELIETYGEALQSRAKYQTDGGEHELILAHCESVCIELEEHLRSSLSNECLRDGG
ncbi:hypothetical protein FHX06_006516 [Rhizobium sp. BK512]|uniref:hypothetical protein n=1 Tax=Rhizobium sp. BK512 TaxID=2587010 RepID=UPI001611B8CC|nr:hypothetical protein [Rhizobium sp. BK512]MBB3565146.1 hypothetical protein [Rhizobium sp. BK512]